MTDTRHHCDSVGSAGIFELCSEQNLPAATAWYRRLFWKRTQSLFPEATTGIKHEEQVRLTFSLARFTNFRNICSNVGHFGSTSGSGRPGKQYWWAANPDILKYSLWSSRFNLANSSRSFFKRLVALLSPFRCVYVGWFQMGVFSNLIGHSCVQGILSELNMKLSHFDGFLAVLNLRLLKKK